MGLWVKRLMGREKNEKREDPTMEGLPLLLQWSYSEENGIRCPVRKGKNGRQDGEKQSEYGGKGEILSEEGTMMGL